jgi:hypothetical protein
MVIQKKWFWEIIISYLPMGHTHRKVDRDLFATIRNLKTIKDCEISRQILQIRYEKF